MVTIGSLCDNLIGKIYGVAKEGHTLPARRAENYHLFRTAKDLDEGDMWRVVFITDRGIFYGHSRFTGQTNFNILDILFVDYDNQLVYRYRRDYPVIVDHGVEINIRKSNE
jgi:hypothetical protein